jgi:hypothetical protein
MRDFMLSQIALEEASASNVSLLAPHSYRAYIAFI